MLCKVLQAVPYLREGAFSGKRMRSQMLRRRRVIEDKTSLTDSSA